jgi:hypothetical protein
MCLWFDDSNLDYSQEPFSLECKHCGWKGFEYQTTKKPYYPTERAKTFEETLLENCPVAKAHREKLKKEEEERRRRKQADTGSDAVVVFPIF